MIPLSCPEVEARLDLYAAGECDPAEAAAVRRHLADCPNCAKAHDEARQLVGLLELRLQEPERLDRLTARLAAEEAPRRRVLRFPAGLRRAAALAAMLLLTVGLVDWLSPGLRPGEGDGGLVAVLHEGARDKQEILLAPAAVGDRAAPGAMQKHSGEAPPAVDLALELRNTTDRPMVVWVAGPPTELRLDVSGPGVVRKEIESAPEPPRAITLRPGESHVLRINRLTDGRRAWYWTKPGDYTVTARLITRATVPGLGDRRITVRSKPVTVRVDKP